MDTAGRGSPGWAEPTPDLATGSRGLPIPAHLTPDQSSSLGGGEDEHTAQPLDSTVGCVQTVHDVKERVKEGRNRL